MSKKLMNTLDEFSSEIYSIVSVNVSLMNSVDDMIKRMINDRFSKMINYTSGELDKAYITIGRNINSLKEKQLKAMEAGTDLGEDEKYDLSIMDIKMKILDTAIICRKEARSKKGDHPILHKHIDHPVFSVDTPRKVTLQKTQKQPGLIIEKREGGYRQLYFKNERGTMLKEYDHKVFSSLCKLCVERGFPKEMNVEISEIIDELKIPNPGGGDYQNVRESLLDIYNTSIVFEDSITKDFDEDTSFEYHRIFQAFSARGQKFLSFRVLFQDYIHQSLRQGEFVNINMYLMNDLTMDTARSLYKFILNEYSKVEREIYEFEFKTLRAHIDLDRSNDHRAHQSIKKAFQELYTSGIISKVEDVKIGTGNWMYYVKPNALQLRHATTNNDMNRLFDGKFNRQGVIQQTLFFMETAAGTE